jgi:hypothetical protein
MKYAKNFKTLRHIKYRLKNNVSTPLSVLHKEYPSTSTTMRKLGSNYICLHDKKPILNSKTRRLISYRNLTKKIRLANAAKSLGSAAVGRLSRFGLRSCTRVQTARPYRRRTRRSS